MSSAPVPATPVSPSAPKHWWGHAVGKIVIAAATAIVLAGGTWLVWQTSAQISTTQTLESGVFYTDKEADDAFKERDKKRSEVVQSAVEAVNKNLGQDISDLAKSLDSLSGVQTEMLKEQQAFYMEQIRVTTAIATELKYMRKEGDK